MHINKYGRINFNNTENSRSGIIIVYVDRYYGAQNKNGKGSRYRIDNFWCDKYLVSKT